MNYGQLECLLCSSEDTKRKTKKTIFPDKETCFDGKQEISVEHEVFQSTRCPR